jgi:endosialidase-like protein
MANAVYPLYKQSILAADTNVSLNVNTTTDGAYCALVDTGTYTYSASHQFYSSLSGVVGADQRISTPTVTNGTFDGDDLTYTSVTGASIEALVIYRHNSGANTTWRLVLYEDTGVTGLPVTPNGGNIVVTWNASGIFTISDRRMKELIKQIGEIVLPARRGSLPLYRYRYRGERRWRAGLMAQDVRRVVPEAVRAFGKRGVLTVAYDRIGPLRAS